MTLQDQFGSTDIYVFDQLLRGNIEPGMRVLDAGCGFGRNLVYMLRAGYDIAAVDADPEAVEHVFRLSQALNTGLPAGNFKPALLDSLPFADARFNVVLCNSVLHFANGVQHFDLMLAELWRVLAPGGLFFCRVGSRIGMDFPLVRDGIYRIGDGSEWFPGG